MKSSRVVLLLLAASGCVLQSKPAAQLSRARRLDPAAWWTRRFVPTWLIGVAGGALWTFARDTTLTCTRLEAAELRCQIKQTWLGQVIKQVEVVNPQQALVQTSHSSKSGTSYRMALVTARGTIPLTDFYSSTRVDKLVDQFNRFAASPT